MTSMTGKTGNLPTDRHWCAVETERLPEVIKAQCDRYWQRLTDRGLLALWRASDRTYYGTDVNGGWKDSAAVTFGGDSDELVVPRVNHYRSLIQAVLATATAERPDFQAQSKSDDTASLMEAPIATGIIKAWWRDKGLELLRQRDAERALLYGVGFMHLRWSAHEGKPVMQPDPRAAQMPMPQGAKPPMVQATDPRGVPMKEGDVIPASCSPVSVIHEMDSQQKTLDWALVAHREDAYDLAARYPQAEVQIRNAIGRPRWPERVWESDPLGEVPAPGDSRITVWCLYHRPTSAVPQGRYSIVAADVVLYDGPAFLKDSVPVYPIIPMVHLDTGEGHSAMWDLLNLQELYDASESAIASMHDAFAIHNVITPSGSGVTSEDLAGGLRVLPYEPGPNGEKPEPLTLLRDVPPIVYERPDQIERRMETVSGVNSTARGNPDPQVKSGSFAALMDSKATHFQSAVRAAVVKHDEDVAGGYLEIVKAVGGMTLVAEIAGRAGSRLKSVSTDEMEQIERVTIEEVSPSLSQPGVRWELTQSLLKTGVVKTGEQALRLFTTGKLEPMFRAPEAELDLINGENDLLMDGQLPPVCYIQKPPPPMPGAPPSMLPPEGSPRTCHPSDDHAIHVREHKSLLDLATRRDPRKVKAIEKHLADHTSVFNELSDNPIVALLTGQTVMPPPPVGAGAPPPEHGGPKGPPDAGGPPPGPGGQGGAPPAPRAKPGGGPGGPEQPLMPQNPATGERVSP